jgi:hypothetical protein
MYLARPLPMKKIIYIIGLLSAMAFCTGWTFGVLHLPGAFKLSIGGAIGFGLIFTPMLALEIYRDSIERSQAEKVKFALGISAALIASLSAILEYSHFQGAGVLLAIATALFVIGFLPLHFRSLYLKPRS